MNNITKIKDRIETIHRQINDLETHINDNPNDYSLKLNYNSLQNHLKDLYNQLNIENKKREKEIIELRFIGSKTKYGSIPLDIVSNLINYFSSVLHSTSYFIQYGLHVGYNKRKIVNDIIDLRLESIGTGSSILYISGNTSPDLFGNSIIQISLDNIFDLLKSDNYELTEKVSNIGSSSIRYFSKFFENLNNNNLEIDLKWTSPSDKELFWDGKKNKINELYITLNQITILNPIIIKLEGELITISSKGKFELLTKEDKRIFGKFSNDLLGKMKERHIGEICIFIIEEQKLFNPISNTEKHEYHLKDIKHK